MTIKAYTRNEISGRSRKRQKIRKEEAEKLGVIRKQIWISEVHLNLLEKSGLGVDEGINDALHRLFENLGKEGTKSLPLEEIDINTMIREQRDGL